MENPVSVVTKTTKPTVLVETKTLQKKTWSSLDEKISYKMFLILVGVITLFTLINFCLLLVVRFTLQNKGI